MTNRLFVFMTYPYCLFADFLSAFGMIHSSILTDSLKEQFGLDSKLITWLLNFLMDRS